MVDQGVGGDDTDRLQRILMELPQNVEGLGKLQNYQVKLHVDPGVKDVNVPPRAVPYHLSVQINEAIEQMIKEDVIEEHPTTQAWVSCAIITPKSDGGTRVTLDVNKALQAANHPIHRLEDIQARLAGARVFSKLDFESAFWQLELHPDSRYLTVFHANNKLYRYKWLTIFLKHT